MHGGDLSAVLRLDRQVYPQPWPAYFFRRLLRANAECWVYEGRGAVIGYAIMQYHQEWAHIMNICIAATYRRQGLGRRMMSHLMRAAHRHGAKRAWLEVKPTNRAAIALYQSMGYQFAKRKKGYYRFGPQRQHDALVMWCRLDM
jgi:ribosomal-protein-alanine N-acetyltransferase